MPESAQQLTEACGPGMPGPYGQIKEIGAAVAGIPPALRRHLPLTREAGSGGVKTPPYEWKIQWQQTQSARAGHARPLRGV